MFRVHIQKLSCKGRISRQDLKQQFMKLVLGMVGVMWCLFLLALAYVFIPKENPNRVVFYMFGTILFMLPIFLLPPFITLFIRRLHDTGRSGWYLALPFLCLIFITCFAALGPTGKKIGFLVSSIGGFPCLYYLKYLIIVQKGDPFENKYGPPSST